MNCKACGEPCYVLTEVTHGAAREWICRDCFMMLLNADAISVKQREKLQEATVLSQPFMINCAQYEVPFHAGS